MYNMQQQISMMGIITVLHTNVENFMLNTVFVILQGHSLKSYSSHFSLGAHIAHWTIVNVKLGLVEYTV